MSLSDQYTMMLDGMSNDAVRSLCHLLLCKRVVDGLNGRTWDASEHRDIEQCIAETLMQNNQPPHSNVTMHIRGYEIRAYDITDESDEDDPDESERGYYDGAGMAREWGEDA